MLHASWREARTRTARHGTSEGTHQARSRAAQARASSQLELRVRQRRSRMAKMSAPLAASSRIDFHSLAALRPYEMPGRVRSKVSSRRSAVDGGAPQAHVAAGAVDAARSNCSVCHAPQERANSCCALSPSSL
jgi:hypothetical protein